MPRNTWRESAEMISAGTPSARRARATAIASPVLPVAVAPAITSRWRWRRRYRRMPCPRTVSRSGAGQRRARRRIAGLTGGTPMLRSGCVPVRASRAPPRPRRLGGRARARGRHRGAGVRGHPGGRDVPRWVGPGARVDIGRDVHDQPGRHQRQRGSGALHDVDARSAGARVPGAVPFAPAPGAAGTIASSPRSTAGMSGKQAITIALERPRSGLLRPVRGHGLRRDARPARLPAHRQAPTPGRSAAPRHRASPSRCRTSRFAVERSSWIGNEAKPAPDVFFPTDPRSPRGSCRAC